MQTQFQYIHELAKQYRGYTENSKSLYDAINTLPKNTVEEIYKEYGDPERDFKPVNLLRAEVARRLLLGEIVSEALVNEIKENIRIKNVEYFNHYKEEFLRQIQEYELFKRDLFANWQNPWSIFHSYFYRGVIRETVLSYLDQIAKDLLLKLELQDYIFHKVDFQGATNFGSDFCWIALYPITKESHKDSYQFFVQFAALPEAGQIAGWSVKEPKPNNLESITSYEDAYNLLLKLKPAILKLNKESRNFFKFAPGSQASEWERFYNEEIIAISYKDFELGDISKYNSRVELNEFVGLPSDSQSNQTWNLWLFKNANIGDVVFANKGVNTCLGIGIITSEYFYDGDDLYNFNHKRKIKWITNKVYQYKPSSLDYPGGGKYKTLFRPDTFSPTKVGEFLINEYIRLYPELASIFLENDINFLSSGAENIEQDNVKQGPAFLKFFNPLLKVLNEKGEGKPIEITKIVLDS